EAQARRHRARVPRLYCRRRGDHPQRRVRRRVPRPRVRPGRARAARGARRHVTDTLVHARELHPGRKNTLDALCERYFIDNAHRTLHGALLDARLLAECYLAMTRGQETLVMELETPAQAAAAAALMQVDLSNLIILPALPAEVALHEQYLDAMEKERKAPSLWRKLAAI